MTLLEYIKQKLSSIRNAALNKARTKTEDQTKYIYEADLLGRPALIKRLQSDLDEQSHTYITPLLNAAYEKYQKNYPLLSDKMTVLPLLEELEPLLKMAIGDAESLQQIIRAAKEDPAYKGYSLPNCIYNLSEFYPHGLPAGNQTFLNNPQKYGFVVVDLSEIQPGDVVLHFIGSKPTHALMFNGWDVNQRPTWNYSNGHIWVGSHKYYPDIENGKGLLKNAIVYRYVGTPQDSTQWKNEWQDMVEILKLGGKINYLNYFK